MRHQQNTTNDIIASRHEITERVRCDYSLTEQQIMNLTKQNVINELTIMDLRGTSVIYESQEITALKSVNAFKNRKIINLMVIGRTQSGKTGCMLATIKKYLEDASNLIPIENIYIITGVSSREWKKQTKERVPENIQARVFHRCDLPITFVDEIKNKKNALIIMDEIQVAAKKKQTIYNAFKKAGLLDKRRLYENDIKILEYTATPDGTIYDLMKWNDASSKILSEPGEGYTSSHDLYLSGRVRQYEDLCGYDEATGEINTDVFEHIKNLKTCIESYDCPRYHIIRTNNGDGQIITIKNFKQSFGPNDFQFIKYDLDSDILDINNTLNSAPDAHTIIFIKEKLRCAKTLSKQYIGILYERYSKHPDDSTIMQALLGRNTGYDDNGVSICFTNVDSVRKYEELWRNNFNDKTNIKWNSKTTIFQNGILSGKNTFNNPKEFGFSVATDPTDEPREPVIQKFRTQELAKEYYIKYLKNVFNGNGPNKRKMNSDGFYEATVRTTRKVYTCDQIRSERRWGLDDKTCRYYPCYKDANDISSLEWWLIYYQK